MARQQIFVLCIVLSVGLANHIQSLTNGTIVYVVTCDDDARTSFNDDARAVLMAIGVDVTGLVHRGKLTFVAAIGRRHQATVVSVALGMVTNAILTKSSENFSRKHCNVDCIFYIGTSLAGE